MTGVTAKTSCCGVSTPASSREATSSWLTIRRRRSAWCAIDSRSARARLGEFGIGPQLGRQHPDAGERRLQVVRDPARKSARTPAMRFSSSAWLRTCACRASARPGAGMLADEAQR